MAGRPGGVPGRQMARLPPPQEVETGPTPQQRSGKGAQVCKSSGATPPPRRGWCEGSVSSEPRPFQDSFWRGDLFPEHLAGFFILERFLIPPPQNDPGGWWLEDQVLDALLCLQRRPKLETGV